MLTWSLIMLPVAGYTFKERLRMVVPLLLPYMGPLFLVFFAEYLINQGVVCGNAGDLAQH